MTFILLKFTLVFTLMSASFISLIYLRPYDDALVRELAESSADCTLPCFMGIRPDVTPAAEALAILENHPWVDSISYALSPDPRRNGWLTWEWSDQRPDWVHHNYLGFLLVTDSVVRGIALDTTIPLGDVVITWGSPESVSNRGRFWYFGGSVKLEVPASMNQTFADYEPYRESRIPQWAFMRGVELLIGNLPIDCRVFHDLPGLPIVVNRSIGAFCGQPA